MGWGGDAMASLFDPPRPLSERERLLAEHHQLLAEYSNSGGERRREIDLRIIAIKERLKDLPPPPKPVVADPPRRRRARAARPRDGRMAATGERD